MMTRIKVDDKVRFRLPCSNCSTRGIITGIMDMGSGEPYYQVKDKHGREWIVAKQSIVHLPSTHGAACYKNNQGENQQKSPVVDSTGLFLVCYAHTIASGPIIEPERSLGFRRSVLSPYRVVYRAWRNLLCRTGPIKAVVCAP